VHKIELNDDQGPYYTGVMNKIKREEFKIDKLIDRYEKERTWDF
jgi:ribosomal protein L31